MNIKNCKNCNIQPEIQSDELGQIYQFICPTCLSSTNGHISPGSNIFNPVCDSSTYYLLADEWNSVNE